MPNKFEGNNEGENLGREYLETVKSDSVACFWELSDQWARCRYCLRSIGDYDEVVVEDRHEAKEE